MVALVLLGIAVTPGTDAAASEEGLRGRGENLLRDGEGPRGGRGSRERVGDSGRDARQGRRGHDRREPSAGREVLVGGRGEDVFYVAPGRSGSIKIRDFDAEEDRLVVGGGSLDRLGSSNLQRTRAGTKLDLSRGAESLEIIFLGVRKRELLVEGAISFESDFPGYGDLQVRALYDDALAHEGPVYLEDSEELVFTSNRLTDSEGSPFVVVSSFDPDSGETTDLGLSDAIPMANGATLSRSGRIIFDRQGNLTASAGLSSYDPRKGRVVDLVSSADGLAFNSPNDVAESSRGELLFTDPQYGFEQGFRPPPELKNLVWLYDPYRETLTVLAKNLVRPNGITLSNDEKFVYVTDSGWAVGDGSIDPDGPRNVYRYRFQRKKGEPFLSDRELLATAKVGIADGVKVDEEDNVWFSTGEGLHVLSPTDEVLGAVEVPGGAANFAITEEGIFVMGETALYLLPRADESERD